MASPRRTAPARHAFALSPASGWLGIGTYVETLRAEIAIVPLGGGATLVTLTLDPAPGAAAFGASVRGALGGTWTARVEACDTASLSRLDGGSAYR